MIPLIVVSHLPRCLAVLWSTIYNRDVTLTFASGGLRHFNTTFLNSRF